MSLFKKSLSTEKTVRGYQVKRLALQDYLNSVDRLKDIPGGLLQACFPGMSLDQIFDSLKKLDEQTLTALLGNAFTVAPRYVVQFVAEITGLDAEKLLADKEVGLDGLAEIIEVFWDINGLSNFTQAVRRMQVPMQQSIGSKT